MNDEQLLRYSRHIMLPEIDIAGQQKLTDARVLIAGIGGLGSPIALYLAAAGVGHLILADPDTVELSNLQRQIIHDTSTLGLSKVDSAKARLQQINPNINVEIVCEQLDAHSLRLKIDQVDLVIDATDNFTIRYALNDYCFEYMIPLVSGAAIRFEGQVAVFDPRDPTSPCYRCLYPETESTSADLNCAENGVAAPLVGIIGSVQAMEALKLICNIGESLTGWVAYLDASHMEWQKLKLSQRDDCPVCSNRVRS